MLLRIDTTSSIQVEVSLFENGTVIRQLKDNNQFGSQVLLPMIQKIVKDQGIELKDLKAIEVATGPGSFTGIRVGVSVANALGFSLGIPVNGKEIETEINY